MIRVCFTVHCFAHAVAALKIAREQNVRAVLVCAPQLIPFAGVRAAVSMLTEAQKEAQNDACAVILDCGGHIGAAREAVRLQNVGVYVRADERTCAQLTEIGTKTGARVLNALPTDGIDLNNHFHLESACRDFIKKQKERE